MFKALLAAHKALTAVFETIKAKYWGVSHPNPNSGEFFLLGRHGPRIRFRCGHLDNLEYSFSAYGHRVLAYDMDVAGFKTLDNALCGECVLHNLRANTIRCCICGRAIIPNQRIVLCYGNVKVMDGITATTVTEGGKAKVSCAYCTTATHAAIHIWDGKMVIPH